MDPRTVRYDIEVCRTLETKISVIKLKLCQNNTYDNLYFTVVKLSREKMYILPAVKKLG